MGCNKSKSKDMGRERKRVNIREEPQQTAAVVAPSGFEHSGDFVGSVPTSVPGRGFDDAQDDFPAGTSTTDRHELETQKLSDLLSNLVSATSGKFIDIGQTPFDAKWGDGAPRLPLQQLPIAKGQMLDVNTIFGPPLADEANGVETLTTTLDIEQAAEHLNEVFQNLYAGLNKLAIQDVGPLVVPIFTEFDDDPEG